MDLLAIILVVLVLAFVGLGATVHLLWILALVLFVALLFRLVVAGPRGRGW